MKNLVLLLVAVITFSFTPTSVFAVMSVQGAAITAPVQTEKKMGVIEKACHKIYATYEHAKASDNAMLAGILGILIGGLVFTG